LGVGGPTRLRGVHETGKFRGDVLGAFAVPMAGGKVVERLPSLGETIRLPRGVISGTNGNVNFPPFFLLGSGQPFQEGFKGIAGTGKRFGGDKGSPRPWWGCNELE